MRNLLPLLLILCLLFGCQIPSSGNNDTTIEEPDDTQNPDNPSGTEDGNEEENTPPSPDYTITFPEEPEITGPAQSPTAEQSAMIERILVNSIGNSAYNGNAYLITDAAEEYAKENPSKGENDKLREVKDYTYGDVRISGWFTIPSSGTFDTPPDIAPCNLNFSISSDSGISEGRLTLSIEQQTLLFAEDITNYIPQGENCVSKINKGFVYQNMDSTSLLVIMTADFEDNGEKHSIYYKQEPKLLDQATGEIDEGALCILDEKTIDYVLLGFDNSVPEPVLPPEYN